MSVSVDTAPVPEVRCYVRLAVTDMPRSGYRWGQRNVYDPPGRQWLSDSETDDVFLVSCWTRTGL